VWEIFEQLALAADMALPALAPRAKRVRVQSRSEILN
jgi:hypothetical protein